jgi:hypothetical protein
VSKSDGRVTITVHHLKKMYVTTSHTKLTSEQERKIEEKLQVIQPQVEIYVSLIRRNRTKIVSSARSTLFILIDNGSMLFP